MKQTSHGIENVLARETRERAILDSRDRPAQRVHARDHQSDSRRLRGNTFVIFATDSYRIGHASLTGKAPRVEADEAACVTSTTTAEEAAGCRSRQRRGSIGMCFEKKSGTSGTGHVSVTTAAAAAKRSRATSCRTDLCGIRSSGSGVSNRRCSC